MESVEGEPTNCYSLASVWAIPTIFVLLGFEFLTAGDILASATEHKQIKTKANRVAFFILMIYINIIHWSQLRFI